MTALSRILQSAIAKQAPIAALVAFAAVLSLVVPSLRVTDAPVLLAAILVTAGATAFAALMSWRPRTAPLADVVPALDFIAIGLLRDATGASASIFTSILVLPVIWYAAQRGVRFIGYALAGTAVALLTPFAFDLDAAHGVSEILRLVFTLLVFTAVAAVVHELSRQSWARVDAARDGEAAARDGEARITREIDRAAAVQRSLLPRALCAVPGVSVAGTCMPASTVGGDFFDWYRTDTGLAITLGDVMGKGVGAGLIAAAVRATIRSARADDDPGAALHRADEGLSVESDERSDAVSFTTLFHARLDGDVLRWADAGHGLSVLVRADGTWERLATTDLPLGLGIDDDWDTETATMLAGDVLVSFSDGVLDLFGGGIDAVDRVVEITRDADDPAGVVEAIAAIASRDGHDDDVTVIALRREPVTVPTGAVTTIDVPATA
jgi:phosphoserine phosphatase RsbU/P